MGPVAQFLTDAWNGLTLEVVWFVVSIAAIVLPVIVAFLLVFVSRVARRLPPIGVWLGLATLPILATPTLSAGLSVAATVFSGLGWTHALFRLHRFQAPRTASRAASTLALVAGVFALGVATTPLRLGFGFASIGVALALFPMLEPRIGPPSRLRRAVPVVVTTYVVLVVAGVFATIAEGSPEGHFPLPPHSLDMPTEELWWLATWQPLLLAAALLLLAGLATCRTRREVVATGLATGAMLLLVSTLLVSNRAVLAERWMARTADVPLAPDGLTPDPLLRGSKAIPPDTPIAELLPRIARGELNIQAHKIRPGIHLGLGTLHLLPACSHAPKNRVAPTGTLGDVIDRCISTRCVLDIPPDSRHDAEEARAEALLSDLTELTSWHPDKLTDHEEAARISLQLRALTHTHTTSRSGATREWEVPWEWAGRPFETGPLEWMEPTPYPDAELHLVDHHQPDGFPAHTMALNTMPRTVGRMTTWSRVPRQTESWVTGPQAVDATLPRYIPDFLVVVKDGMVIDVRTSTPDPALIREWLGLQTTPRPRLDKPEPTLKPGDCASVPSRSNDPGTCAANTLTCGDHVVDRITVDTPNAFPTSLYDQRDPALGSAPSLDGPDRAWMVEVPANTIARIDVHASCGTVSTVLFEGTAGGESCPQVARYAQSMDYPWQGSSPYAFDWMKSGTHLLVIESATTPTVYELDVSCSKAVPGSGVDTGLPAGLY